MIPHPAEGSSRIAVGINMEKEPSMPSQTITQAGACPRASRARALSCDDRSCPDRERVPEAAEWIDRPHVFAEL